ncbi:MAG: enhanced serine sensitivity protein SseB [Planctomycetaceae bacterium]|nr:enhanced serine sensitivity protein SseB [Planctomycetaceae bacterium]
MKKILALCVIFLILVLLPACSDGGSNVIHQDTPLTIIQAEAENGKAEDTVLGTYNGEDQGTVQGFEGEQSVMFDINQPVTNHELIAAIDAIRAMFLSDTEDTLVNALKESRFLCPVTISPLPEPDGSGTSTLKVDTTISFFGLTDANGDNFLPVYTDWPALKLWRDIPDEQTLVVTYDDISGMVMKDPKTCGFVINPYSHNFQVSRDTIERINAGPVTSWTAKEETQVLIGLPANDPLELKDAISNYLKTQDNVKGVWLVLMHKGGEQSFVLVVDYVGDRRVTFNGIASVAVPKLRQGELLDMVPANEDFGQSITRDYPPFYQRKE